MEFAATAQPADAPMRDMVSNARSRTLLMPAFTGQKPGWRQRVRPRPEVYCTMSVPLVVAWERP
jgi:hypothetical protein